MNQNFGQSKTIHTSEGFSSLLFVCFLALGQEYKAVIEAAMVQWKKYLVKVSPELNCNRITY